MSNSRKSGILVFIVCAFGIGLVRPFDGLAPQGHYIISVTLISLALWIFKTDSIPYIAGGVLFLTGCLIFKLPLSAITTGYTSSAIWVLIPALKNRPG
jgi:FtsH-binding integral membrane protein